MSWAAFAGILATIIAISTLLDWMLSREEVDREKATLIQWWLRLESFSVADAIRKASVFFNQKFDLLYGAKALSWRRCWISFLTTVSIVGTVSIAFFATGGDVPRNAERLR